MQKRLYKVKPITGNKSVNNWVWALKIRGRMAETSFFFGRAATQCMVGIIKIYIG
jgi:hypothetical protein